MKKKYMIILIIILTVVLGIPCWVNMSNFYLGSNSMFYRTFSDYPNSKWICENANAIINVTYAYSGESIGTKSTLEIITDGIKNKYIISNRLEIFDLFLLDQNDNQLSDDVNDQNGNVIRTHVKYKKDILGNVVSFQITVNQIDQTIAGYKTLKFTRES